MSAIAFEWLRNLALSAWTAGVASSALSCSYFASIAASFSSTVCPLYPKGSRGFPDALSHTASPARSVRVTHSRTSFAASRDWRQERDLVPVANARREPRVFLVHRHRDRFRVVRERRELAR